MVTICAQIASTVAGKRSPLSHLDERSNVFLFAFTGVGAVLRFPWHLVRGLHRYWCRKRLRVFRCCLILIPLLWFQTVGHLRRIVLANNAWRNEFNKRQRGNRSKNSNGSYTSHVKTQPISFKQHLFCSAWYNLAFFLLCFVGEGENTLFASLNIKDWRVLYFFRPIIDVVGRQVGPIRIDHELVTFCRSLKSIFRCKSLCCQKLFFNMVPMWTLPGDGVKWCKNNKLELPLDQLRCTHLRINYRRLPIGS